MTTPGHPFYVTERSDAQPRPKPVGHEDLNDNWVGAGHLKVGDKIKKADGTFGIVKYVNTVQETRTMYNLDVAVADTFFVGTQGWLVHNENSKGLYNCGGLSLDEIADRIGAHAGPHFLNDLKRLSIPPSKAGEYIASTIRRID